jgi:ureidoglycolate hydrolase
MFAMDGSELGRHRASHFSDLPEPESLPAFLVGGAQGILIWRDVWHTLSRYPVRAEGASFAFLTTAETQAELELTVADRSVAEADSDM